VAKRRIDILLVEKGLVESREKARVMVMEGAVTADNRTIVKPSTLVDENADLQIIQAPTFVSRGGFKLEYALDQFQIDVKGLVAVDVGASTGGFTDCLLKRGASKVYAVDVGYGQLDYKLRQDHRVVVMERVNARYSFSLPEPVDLATVDVSFISLEKVVPAVAELVKSGGYIITLVKPQFEAGKNQVGKGGLVKDPQVHAAVLGRFIDWAIAHDFRLLGLVASPILGAEGNKEFLALLQKHQEL
jgi:23S rRNA (cytidine1920-2'-O)/16S rRNA (cytidine1409-2'-O)-methyltransferase